jgi:hypothetical protein
MHDPTQQQQQFYAVPPDPHIHAASPASSPSVNTLPGPKEERPFYGDIAYPVPRAYQPKRKRSKKFVSRVTILCIVGAIGLSIVTLYIRSSLDLQQQAGNFLGALQQHQYKKAWSYANDTMLVDLTASDTSGHYTPIQITGYKATAPDDLRVLFQEIDLQSYTLNSPTMPGVTGKAVVSASGYIMQDDLNSYVMEIDFTGNIFIGWKIEHFSLQCYGSGGCQTL